ncbi:hypothetical protein AB0D71_27415 [Streptomyces avermitilis]|uniref:hypothetical protein n=1 Tax=Streptomyces avermitilis TaxID=33903 RepID=UPI00340A5722
MEVSRAHPPYAMLDAAGAEVEPVTAFLRDLALGDSSPLTCRSYGYGMLWWFRLLWLLGTGWEQATESEVRVLTGWLRAAANPQRQRHRADASVAGTVNLRTGKSPLCAGHAPRTINHALPVISGFYEFHAHQGRGPVVNPVPHSAQRRRALGHRSPLEPTPVVGRARLRRRVPDRPPRSIPDRLWDELFTAMNCGRDRALLEIYVSSGARAEELVEERYDRTRSLLEHASAAAHRHPRRPPHTHHHTAAGDHTMTPFISPHLPKQAVPPPTGP